MSNGISRVSYKENDLVNGIKKQDKIIFKYLYDQFFQRLFLYARSYVGEEQVAKDIVQELFFRLWAKNKEINFPASVSAYLFRAVHNSCIQFLRHKCVEKNYQEHSKNRLQEAEIVYHNASDYVFSSFSLKEIRQQLRKILKQMPEKTCEIFLLSRELGNKNKEIAKNLGISIKTVEYHLSNALSFLREHMKDYLPILFLLNYFVKGQIA